MERDGGKGGLIPVFVGGEDGGLCFMVDLDNEGFGFRRRRRRWEEEEGE